ncbi:N-acetylmuramic acid/N-acetylglucosamine kinase [Austwickia sp. TVS 96-490-7B]|uniref:BadF/BadG/BcrA/BcrD ATPase family protein n=1 Tax=Austwickia sp. TVS 96-490-7B TaxID=2830843 RepID=UPI001C595028|nr:BadF/BadG/BcrA/BcrD ATPase family protein [Austwickia sp. TVS 96-490-7B]MBW3085348.1 N-acetylmuramic acid/N-acetylglucosamine kinase [Austwickia sp. TVS 96-490-7B]
MSAPSEAPPTSYAVADCGGTHTRLEIWHGTTPALTETFGSANTASRSADEALDVYSALIARVAEHHVTATYIATAGFDDTSADTLAAQFRSLAITHQYDGTIHLVNDVAPLLFSGAPGTETVAAIIGTGSAFWTRDATDSLTRVGGVEWLASDEGAAVDLGKRALIAMVRAADGRGPATTITTHANLNDADTLHLARTLGETAHPKQHLAGLAPAVTTAWTDDHDPVATEIITAAVADVEAALAASARFLSHPAAASWLFCGGLVSGSDDYQQLILAAATRASGGATDLRVVQNALDLLRSFAAHGWANRVGERYVRTVER